MKHYELVLLSMQEIGQRLYKAKDLCMHCACNVKENLDRGERLPDLRVPGMFNRGLTIIEKEKRKEVKKEKVGDNIKFR